MRHLVRGVAAALTAIGVVITVPCTSTVTALVTLAATALYMGGTGHPLSIPGDSTDFIASYVAGADSNYVAPSGLCTGGDPGCLPVAVYTPEQFRFDTGLKDMTFDQSVATGVANLDACISGVSCTVTDPPYSTTGVRQLTDSSYVVYGYSQSATVAGVEKDDLIAHPPAGTVSFVLTANPNRPNGGVLERFVGVYIPLVGVTFTGATPTNSPEPTPLTTVDVARQYDPAADFPTNPLNVLADLNVALGFLYLHPDYYDVGTPELQGMYRDTTYYLIPTPTLPLLMPVEQIPFVGPPVAAALDPPLRVLVESGYDRTLNPGQPTPAQWLYLPSPVKTCIDFAVAIPTGWDDSIAYLTGDPADRPFHTTPQPTYGVGGPPVDAGAVDPYGPPTPYAAPQASDEGQSNMDGQIAVTEDNDLRTTPPPDAADAAARPQRLTSRSRTAASDDLGEVPASDTVVQLDTPPQPDRADGGAARPFQAGPARSDQSSATNTANNPADSAPRVAPPDGPGPGGAAGDVA